MAICRERGYLPADYRELPASHQRSILGLTGLTRDEIAEAYDRFTALRERLWAGRHPSAETGHVGRVAAVA